MQRVELRKVGAPGRGEVWSLEIEPRQFTLRDAEGALQNAASLEEGLEFITLPSFARNRKYTEIAGPDGVLRFSTARQGQRIIVDAMRRAAALGSAERIT